MARRPGFLVRLALAAIRGYQHYLSPHKGFSCAYRCATGRDGCSGYGYRVIERCGLPAGLALLRRRLRLCGDTYRRRAEVPNPGLYYQRGDCDPGCGGCDCAPDLSCCDCSDFRSWWREFKSWRYERRQRRRRLFV